MATTLSKYKSDPAKAVGVAVYQAFVPQKPGVIIEFVGMRQYGPNLRAFPVVRVVWINGTQIDVDMGRLNDFDALIADHAKKLRGHKASRLKLFKIAEPHLPKSNAPKN